MIFSTLFIFLYSLLCTAVCATEYGYLYGRANGIDTALDARDFLDLEFDARGDDMGMFDGRSFAPDHEDLLSVRDLIDSLLNSHYAERDVMEDWDDLPERRANNDPISLRIQKAGGDLFPSIKVVRGQDKWVKVRNHVQGILAGYVPYEHIHLTWNGVELSDADVLPSDLKQWSVIKFRVPDEIWGPAADKLAADQRDLMQQMGLTSSRTSSKGKVMGVAHGKGKAVVSVKGKVKGAGGSPKKTPSAVKKGGKK
ncbi:hypothetical protein FA13DRAFT_1775964 [Coprinellus micaceus]|uniref:Uncharacterized protein n=1 Tax=Coprinellus micaceus TaxID=71717 RepID=A0A4Y7T3T9_COPMI|nr:hypothetical protein FA13DRAFT_1775964 [Coprinellus micaceus]